MNIKKPYIIIISFSLLFFIVSEIIAFYVDYQNSKYDVYKDDRTAIDNLLTSQEENLRMFATFLSNDTVIIQAYEQNNPQKIIEHVSPIWKKMKQEQLVYEIHFFKPPAISFVNFSNFHSIGKDVSKARKDIVWVTSSFKPSTHNLMCKTYAGIRATYPIINEHHQLLGGLSLGKKIDWLPKAVKKNTTRDAFLVYTKASAQTLDPKYYKDFMKDKTLVGEYILANSTIAGVDAKLLKKIDFHKDIQYLNLNGHLYLLDKYPIIDFSKKTMAYVFILNDIRPYYVLYMKDLMMNFILILITSIIIFFVTKKALGDINKKLKKSVHDLNVAQHSAKMGSYIYNIRTEEIEWSQNHYTLFKVSPEKFKPTRQSFREFVHPDDREYVAKQLEYALVSKERLTIEYRVVLHDGTLMYVRSISVVIEDNVNNLQLLNGTIQDITEYKKLELENQKKTQQLQEQLYTDELTALPNRRALSRDMKMYREATLAIINIKSFKNINDVFGFDVGNFILESLSSKLLEYIKPHQLLLYRIGSDEFALLNNSLENDFFRTFIAQIIDSIEKEVFVYTPKDIEVNISIYAGVCLSKHNRMACADVALNEANKLHKDYVVYSSSENLIEEQEHKIKMINIIKNALLEDKILLYAQPIVNKDGTVHKYETLVRLEHDGKILSPFHFLEISKKTKYYPLITRRMVKNAFELFAHRKEYFSINLVAEDILNETTLAFIRKEVAAFEEKERIVFEIVESEDIYKIQEVADFIKEMQSLGVQIAIDDFGTGYSNFSYLMELKPEYIKIDGSLIKDIDTNTNARNIVTTIIAFAKELNCKTVAEYIHAEEIFAICKELGIDEYQGYYFSEPKELS